MKNPKAGVILALVFAASMWFYVYRVLVPYQREDAAAHGRPRGNLSDLYPRWLGSRELLLHHRNPYSPEVTREIQAGYYGRELDANRPEDPRDQQGFVYPVYVVFLLAPTLRFPFSVVMVSFYWLLVTLTAASVGLWLLVIRWRPDAAVTGVLVVLTLGSFPAMQGFKLQQLSLLVSALIALSLVLLTRGRFFAAGLVLAMATIKPQLVLPLLVTLLLWTVSEWKQRQRFLWGFGVAMAILLVGAEILLPGWFGDFRAAARDYRRYTGGQSLLDVLLSPVAGHFLSVIVLLVLIFVSWRFRRSEVQAPEFPLLVASALAVSLIVIPTFAPYNQLLLLPAVLLVARSWRLLILKSAWSRVAYWVMVAVVGWPWLASLVLVMVSVWLPAATVQKAWAVPLYTSLAIPFALLVPLATLVSEAWSDGLNCKN